jgi:peptidoglycan L-alanyl-D-glutamate endopeptidase CwlK
MSFLGAFMAMVRGGASTTSAAKPKTEPPPLSIPVLTAPTLGLTARDMQRLAGVHPDLVRVVKRCAAGATTPRFMVIEGLRTKEREAEMVAAGKSQTMNSRHLTGHAVDLGILGLSGTVDWTTSRYRDLNTAMAAAAMIEGVPLGWGGDWKTLKDFDHWELPRKEYPA